MSYGSRAQLVRQQQRPLWLVLGVWIVLVVFKVTTSLVYLDNYNIGVGLNDTSNITRDYVDSSISSHLSKAGIVAGAKREHKRVLPEKVLPQKGDSNCNVLIKDIYSNIKQSNLTRSGSDNIVTSFIPVPRPCPQNGEGGTGIGSYSPILPPLQYMLPYINPATNDVDVVFSLALNDVRFMEDEILRDHITWITKHVLQSSLIDFNQLQIKGTNVTVNLNLNMDDVDYQEITQNVIEEQGLSKYLEMFHVSTELEEIMMLPKPSEYWNWWKVRITFGIYEPDLLGELIPQIDSDILEQVEKQLMSVMENTVIDGNFTLSLFREGLEMFGVSIVSGELILNPPSIDTIIQSQLNQNDNGSSNINANGKTNSNSNSDDRDASRSESTKLSSSSSSPPFGGSSTNGGTFIGNASGDTFIAKYGPSQWTFRQFFGVVMFLATLSWVTILFIVSSQRQKLRKERHWWGVQLSEDGLEDFLRYSFKVDTSKGGSMVIFSQDSNRGRISKYYSPRENDDDSFVLIGGKHSFRTDIVTPETIHMIRHLQENNNSNLDDNSISCVSDDVHHRHHHHHQDHHYRYQNYNNDANLPITASTYVGSDVLHTTKSGMQPKPTVTSKLDEKETHLFVQVSSGDLSNATTAALTTDSTTIIHSPSEGEDSIPLEGEDPTPSVSITQHSDCDSIK